MQNARLVVNRTMVMKTAQTRASPVLVRPVRFLLVEELWDEVSNYTAQGSTPETLTSVLELPRFMILGHPSRSFSSRVHSKQ